MVQEYDEARRRLAIAITGSDHMSVSFDLSGRVALVTAAAAASGEPMAKGFAHKVRRTWSSRAASRKPVTRWRPRSTRRAARPLRSACHIGDMDALQCAVCARPVPSFGRLDVLVNNARANPYYGHVLDTDLGAFQKTVDVNIRGYFFASVLGGTHDARTGQRLDHQRRVGERGAPGPEAGDLLDHQGRCAQHDEDVRKGVRPARYPAATRSCRA